jgi:hypothetical protein
MTDETYDRRRRDTVALSIVDLAAGGIQLRNVSGVHPNRLDTTAIAAHLLG